MLLVGQTLVPGSPAPGSRPPTLANSMEVARIREDVQRKQQRWMAERQLALDRKAVMGSGSSMDDAQVLGLVTDKIAERLQAEMHLQNARAMQDGAVGDRVEKLLEQHLEAHTCGICFELMSGKEHHPTLLFPCAPL